MTKWRVRWSRTKALLLGRRREDELADEIELHLEHLTAEYVTTRLLTTADARLRARREFGGVSQTREAFRDQRRWPSIDTFFQDCTLRHARADQGPRHTPPPSRLLTVGVGTTVVTAGCSIVCSYGRQPTWIGRSRPSNLRSDRRLPGPT